MTSQREFDRLLETYFDDGRDELADRVIDAALAKIDQTKQRRVLRVPWRFPTMSMPIRVAALAVIGALVLGGAFLFAGRARPTVVAPTPSPTAAPPAWRTTGSPSRDRGNAGVAARLADGRVLVAGGLNSSGAPLATAELYDPTSGAWSPTGSLATPRDYPTMTVLANGNVLVAGGSDRSGPTSTAEIYDAATGAWSAAGAMTTPRGQAFAARLADGRVLVAGGEPGGSAELFDPSTGRWAVTGSLPAERNGPLSAITLPDGRVLVTGGFTRDNHSTAVYDPRTGRWTSSGTMPVGLVDEQSGILLSDGTVLIAGGHPSAAARFNPSTGVWTATGPLIESYADLVGLVQLSDGKVLLVGGGGAKGGATATAQLFDPTTGTWSTADAPSLTQAKYVRSAFGLPDGTVLVVGSATTDADGAPSAERYGRP